MTPPPESRSDVAWGACAAALLVAQQITGKATRDALYLSFHPAATLPGVMIGASLIAVAAALGAGRLLTKHAPRRIVPALVGLNAALLLGQFLLASTAPALAGTLLYLQLAATGGTLLSGYWSVVSERFDPWSAKRVVTRLGFGASIGGILGGVLALASARLLPLLTLLPITAALNVGAFVCLVRFAADATGERPRLADTAPARPLGSMPYLRLLALLVALGSGAETLIDYVFKARAAATLPAGPELMTFFAAYHTAISLLGLFSQTLLTRPALQGLGLARTTALRPLYVAATTALGLVDLRLWSAVLARAGQDVLSNSLFRSAYELLYTPLPENQKRATKQVVDVAFDKVGSVVGGSVALLAVRLLDAPERALLFVAGGVSLLALGLTRRLHDGYVGTLEDGLRAGEIHLAPDDVRDSTTHLTMVRVRTPSSSSLSAQETPVQRPTPRAAGGDALVLRIADLRSSDTARIRRAIGGSDSPPEPALVAHLVPLLARDDVALEAFRGLKPLAARAAGEIADAILDAATDPVVRRRLPRLLSTLADPRATEALLQGLEVASFPVRAACATALARQTRRSPARRVPAERVFAAVGRELAFAESEARVGTQASLAQIFTLLSLILERGALRTAERALAGSDAGLRGTALEYLETVLPRELAPAFLRLALRPRG